jgi:hypothetical protein
MLWADSTRLFEVKSQLTKASIESEVLALFETGSKSA